MKSIREMLKSTGMQLAVRCLLLIMGLYATLGAFLEMFDFPHRVGTMLAACLFAAVFTVVYLLTRGKAKALILIGLLLLWLWIGYRELDVLLQGAKAAENHFVPPLTYIVSYQFGELPLLTADDRLCLAALWVYWCVPLAAALSWAVVIRGSAIISILLTAPVFGFTYALLGLPSRMLVVLQFAFWLTLLLMPRRFWKQEYFDARAPLMSMAVSALAVALCLSLAPEERYVASPATYGIREDLINTMLYIQYYGILPGVPGYAHGAPLTGTDGSVNLNAMGSIRFPDLDIMDVYSEVPHHLYLRAYSASLYTGDEWLRTNSDEFYDSGISIDPLAYMEQVGNIYFDEQPSLVTIKPYRTNYSYMFLPYLYVGMEDQTDLRWGGDAYALSDGRTSYSVWSYSGAELDAVITDGRRTGLRSSVYAASAAVRNGYFSYGGYALPYTSSLEGPVFIDDGTIPQDVLIELQDYVNNPPVDLDTVGLFYPMGYRDADYLNFIIDTYTQLPDGVQDMLLDWWSNMYDQREFSYDLDVLDHSYYYYYLWSSFYLPNYSDHVPFWNWIITARQVAEEVQQAARYTTDPGRQPANRDFVEYFLNESRQGYCVHFASATAAMLRALGVPARYVEGYVIEEEDFDENGWVSVPADSAHAWAEIWVPNFGWIPVDATPGEAPVEVLDEAEFALTEEDEEERQPDVEDEETDDTEHAQALPLPVERDSGLQDSLFGLLPGVDRGQPAHPVVLILVLLGAGILGLLCNRWLKLRRRRRDFASKDSSQAVLHLYSYLEQLSAYGASISPEATQLARKARFSTHPPSPAEVQALHQEMRGSRRAVMTRLSRRQRFLLWLRGIL